MFLKGKPRGGVRGKEGAETGFRKGGGGLYLGWRCPKPTKKLQNGLVKSDQATLTRKNRV